MSIESGTDGDDFVEFDLPESPSAVSGAEGEDSTFAQADIDALFGGSEEKTDVKQGLRAVIESRIIIHERLPVLEVVCERMVRTFATNMRNLTSDAIDISLDDIETVRFGDFMNRVQLPAMIGVFKVPQWENYGLIVVDSGLIYAVVDALLGGRKGNSSQMIDGRGFTSIETLLVSKMLNLMLEDLAEAFQPVSPITLELERIESNPRFAAIASPSNIASAATFRIDMDGRGGPFTVLFPSATLEPVKSKLIRRFMGENVGGDRSWLQHMDDQVRQTELELDVVLGERTMTLSEIESLQVGQTVSLGQTPDHPVDVQSAGQSLAQAHIGQRRAKIAVALCGDVTRRIRS
ncbi:flagellar motor switch protein FliM [Sphingorhabdus sp. M41]|uniref:flagellar motor switch protein FliM n=1 Tax=Sphingorhabdus sp. M41 TaxID=1806885 RepID=UPI00078E08A4|nr:flagellar motor switch protein FliM [Sphingorhabdus sp. M41]AMO72597.1 flagellar motor switch protein FliM [Sphingorhabdus sp. M41]